jgi:ATP-dependent DNA helicase RecG
MGYFREHLQTRFEFTGEPAREVFWEYPLEALREAITNAVCHRDYLEVPHIQVRWYDDRLTFFNPGGLPPPLRLEDLKREHPSNPRNRLIAEMFFYLGWIERWGGGIQKMLNECAAAGLPEPEFEEAQGALWLTFRKDLLTDEHLRSLGLTERQIKAVRWVKERSRITNAEYQQLFQVSKRTASDDLSLLETKGLLERVGKRGKGTYYHLKGP